MSSFYEWHLKASAKSDGEAVAPGDLCKGNLTAYSFVKVVKTGFGERPPEVLLVIPKQEVWVNDMSEFTHVSSFTENGSNVGDYHKALAKRYIDEGDVNSLAEELKRLDVELDKLDMHKVVLLKREVESLKQKLRAIHGLSEDQSND